ncbi:MAG: hypothetical protein L6R42_001733 [Xanthoria sp. 1 TBL-2021]|nr:MAG: hypothetical protein L6R42_001733 [Xanthoria sp. 1 TBL-2021]
MGDYTKLASMMANHAEAAIFRRFDTLNIKNLLYMQAELVDLEDQLYDIESQDKKSRNRNKVLFSSSVQTLRKSASTRDNDQWMKYKKVQEKMHAYNDALLQYLSLRKVAKPTSNDVKVLRDWLEQDTGGALFLKGIENTTWKANEDFLSLDPEQAGRDSLTRLINQKLVPWYHRRWGYRSKPSSSAEWDGVWDYHKDKLEKIANGISTLLAALLPSISILILYFVSKPASRLITISLFSVVFSLILTTVSAAKRVEVFAATTA